MKCFVIMPFAVEFDDVYLSIKDAVENALSGHGVRCSNLKEERPAGRITERLLRELQAASFCVADVTGVRPNVMWEIGYAAALLKPVIIAAQGAQELPFDIKDMEAILYDRSRLKDTLATPLRKVVVDTANALQDSNILPVRRSDRRDDFAELKLQVAELKDIIAQAVGAWSHGGLSTRIAPRETEALKRLEGAWVGFEYGSHLYARVVRGELVVPYCYSGNSELVGVFFDWRRVGNLWFARFQWLAEPEVRGFAFMREESADLMAGEWWHEEAKSYVPFEPPLERGRRSSLRRQSLAETPKWATQFFAEVERGGLTARLKRGA